MVFIILVTAVVLSIMFWAVILPFKPESVKIVGKFVCKPNEKMEVSTSNASYHQRGERSIQIYCNDYGNKRLVNGKTFLFAFLFSFVLMLPFSFIIVFAVYKYFGL
ncbi:MAG TPA: hypothetical protein PKY59_21320 [Pyrinomonadaceae bacterium]|nr:hypothetical protein [Pyrinomonadaceae bacterium]